MRWVMLKLVACVLKAEKGSYIIFCIVICLANRFTYIRNGTMVCGIPYHTICTANKTLTHNTLLHLKGVLSLSLVYDLVRFDKHLSRIPKIPTTWRKKGSRERDATTIEQQRVEKRLRYHSHSRFTLYNLPDFIGCCVKSC